MKDSSGKKDTQLLFPEGITYPDFHSMNHYVQKLSVILTLNSFV